MRPVTPAIQFTVRLAVGSVLFSVAALVSACGGGGGGGGGSAGGGNTGGGVVPPPVVAPRPVNCGATLCATLANDQRTGEFNNQYGLANVNAHYAYAYGQHRTGSPFSGRGVTVAVVDSGVDRNHSEFSGRILPGHNAVAPGDPVVDPFWHGTGVAGVIAAAKTNSADGANVHGVAYESVILPVQTANDASGAFPLALAGLAYAVTSDAFIVNNSWDDEFLETVRLENGLALETDFKPFFAEGIADILRAAETDNLSDKALLDSLKNPDIIDEFGKSVLEGLNNGGNGVISAGEVDRLARSFLAELEADLRFALAVRGDITDENDPIVVFAAGNSGFNTETGKNRWEIVSNPANPGTAGDFINVDAETNLGGFWGQLPLLAPGYQNNWINVVAVDRNNRIASFSNGCGASKNWCLAAPGVDIIIPDLGGGRRTASGTSFAAPHVSGAAAVLKSAFPNMSPRQVAALLLATARDLGAPGVDDVYGRGLLDLENAARPRPGASGFRLAYSASPKNSGLALDDFAFASLADSRIASSPALFPRAQNIPVGFLDGFDRAYQAGFAGFVSPTAAPDAEFFFSPHSRARALRGGFYARGAEGEPPRAFGWRRRRGGVFADVFQVRRHDGGMLSPLRPGTDFAFALGAGRARGAALGTDGAAVGAMRAESANGADIHAWAAAFSRGGDGWRASWESGMALEEGSALGAKFDGAFAVRRARTLYSRLSGSFSLTPRVRLFASGTAARTRAEADLGAIADFSQLRARGWSAGVAGDAWRLSFSRPLRTSSGAMRIRTAGGYDDSGAYAIRESVVDLSSPRAWRASAEWISGDLTRLRSELSENGRANFAAEFLF